MAKRTAKKESATSRRPSFKDRRSLFVREYLIDRNATQAAIRAGYSPKSARVTGHRLLTDAAIAAQVAETTTTTLNRLAVTKERITEELARVAFSDIGDYASWGMRKRVQIDKQGNAHTDELGRVDLVESTEVDPEARRAISEISEGREGLKIKLHDKLGALKMLGSELGMFRERQAGDAPDNPFHLLVEAVQRHAAPLPIRDQNAGLVARGLEEVRAPAADKSGAQAAAPRTISPLLRP